MKYYVYALLRPYGALEPCYIGKGWGKRAWEHQKAGDKHPNKHLASIFKKVGGSLPIIMLHEGLKEDVALAYEVILIAAIGRADLGRDPLTNRTDGGEGLCNPSPETLQKLIERATSEWASSEGREKKMIGLLAALSRPGVIETKSMAQVSSWAKPSVRENRVNGLKKTFARAEVVEPIRQRMLGNDYGKLNKGRAKTPEHVENWKVARAKTEEDRKAAGLPHPNSGPRPGGRKPWSAARRAAYERAKPK